MHAWLAFVIGILAATGAILLYAALSGASYAGLTLSAEETIAVTVFIIALILGLILYAAIKAQFKHIKTGKEALIGASGTATTDLNPKGEVRVMGEFWQANAKDTTITKGQTIEVLSMDGNTLVVKPAEQKA